MIRKITEQEYNEYLCDEGIAVMHFMGGCGPINKEAKATIYLIGKEIIYTEPNDDVTDLNKAQLEEAETYLQNREF